MLQSSVFYFSPTCSAPYLTSLPPFFSTSSNPPYFSHSHCHWQPKHAKRKKLFLGRVSSSYEVGGGYPDEEFEAFYKSQNQQVEDNQNMDSAPLSKGVNFIFMLKKSCVMWVYLEDMNMNEASEEVAVELAAQGVIGKRVDEMEGGFMMALDYMIQVAEKDQDDKVQVVGLLFRTPQKESRHELLWRVAAGGGVFKSEIAPRFILLEQT